MLATLNAMEMRSEFVGKTFHYLVVTDVVPHGQKTARLLCSCRCGKSILATPRQMRLREITSCGCWKRQVLGVSSTTHGLSNSSVKGYASRTYGVWQAMRDRCSNPNRKDFYRYGGRGITVCERWQQFEHFLADMGEAPAGLTLDRIDNNAGYAPENCRWATRHQQTYNSSHMKYIEHRGETMCLSAWQKKMGVKPHTYYSRLRRGWSVKQALLLTT